LRYGFFIHQAISVGGKAQSHYILSNVLIWR
jgi:hypothetical protein